MRQSVRLLRPTLSTALLLAVALASSPARAQSPDERAVAELLFEQGRTLVEAGDFADACPKLAESQRVDPAIGTMLWLADCYASNGQTASAWAWFVDVSGVAARKKDAREQVARAKASALEARLSRLMVVVPPGAATSGLEVRRDGVAVGQAEWGLPVPLDPGIHTVSARAPGHRPWSATIRLATGPTSLSVTVPVLEVETAPPSPAPPPLPAGPADAAATPRPSAAPVAPTDRPATAPRYWSSQRYLGVALAGAGVVGIVVGGVFSLEAKSTYDESTSGPCNANNVCSREGLNDRSSAQSMATVATVAMGVGAAALAAGAVTFFTAPRGGAPLTVTPAVASGSASLWVSGAF